MTGEHLFMAIVQLILMSILGMAIGSEYGAAFGFMSFVAIPLLVWIIREVKA